MNIGENMFSQFGHNGTKTTPALIALSLLLSSLLIFNPVAQAEDISDETYHISIVDNDYDPNSLTILLGDTVIWTNNGNNVHEVYNPDHFDSEEIQPGGTYTVEFTTANEYQADRNYNYQDTNYPEEMNGLVKIDDGEITDYDEYFVDGTPTYETPGHEIVFSYDIDSTDPEDGSAGTEDVNIQLQFSVWEDGDFIVGSNTTQDHVINGEVSESFSQNWTAPEEGGIYEFRLRIKDMDNNKFETNPVIFSDIELPYTAGGVNVNLQVKSYGDDDGGVNDLLFKACSKTSCNKEGVTIKTFDSADNVVDMVETDSNGRVIIFNYVNGDYTFKSYNNEEQTDDDIPFDEGSFVVNNFPPSENELGTATYQERNSTHLMNYFVVCKGADGNESTCKGNPRGALDDAYVLFYSMDDVFVENCPTDVFDGNSSVDEHGYVCFSDFTEEWEEDFYKFELYDNNNNMLQSGNFYYVPLPCDEGEDCVEWFDEDVTTLVAGDTDADDRQDGISFGYDAQTNCGCTVDIRVILSITGTEGGSYGNLYFYQSIYSDSRSDEYEGSWQAEEHDTYTFHFKLYDNSTSDMEDDFIYPNIELYGPNQAPEIDDLDTPSESTTQYEGEELQFSFSATDSEGDDIEYEWDFGDGSAKVSGEGDSSSTTHTYIQDGDYNVTLSLKDEHRGYAPDTIISFTVSNLPPEVMEINATGDFRESYEVSFSADSSDPGAEDSLTYSWNFGDGSDNVTAISPSHIYGDDGTFTVTLVVCDDSGDCDTTSSVFDVSNIPPTIDDMRMNDPSNTGFGRDNYRVNETAEFAAQITEEVDMNITFTWEFGDGTNSIITYCITNNENPDPNSDEGECDNEEFEIENGDWVRADHIYLVEGNYTVGLTITDGTDTDYWELYLTIDPLPIPGCMDQAASNYDADATALDDSCVYEGCTDSTATNHDENADIDDGSCVFPQDNVDVWGCMDPEADNYNPAATIQGTTSCDYGEDNQTIPDNGGDDEEDGGFLEAIPGVSLLAMSSILVLLSLLRRRI